MHASYKRACSVLGVDSSEPFGGVVSAFMRGDQSVRHISRPWSYKTRLELARAAAYIFSVRWEARDLWPDKGWTASAEERQYLRKAIIRFQGYVRHYERLYRNNLRIQLIEALHAGELLANHPFPELWDIHLTCVLRPAEPLSTLEQLRYVRFEHNPTYDQRLHSIGPCRMCRGRGIIPLFSKSGFVREFTRCEPCHGLGRNHTEHRLTEVLRLHPVTRTIPLDTTNLHVGKKFILRGQGHTSLTLGRELIRGDLHLKIRSADKVRPRHILPPRDGEVEFTWFCPGREPTRELYAPTMGWGWYT